ncbi:probable glucan endo-1,3-beta-glucosidase BG5 [Benincasa hispida]|uniref:probable glucan endo-1,3-beta-glucosidase BG5 n=1 Tax=Benincasa hispida TaxID=102211 RepID=UPI0018FF8E8E|nr:probable glucan endo-1,3-beta-glucosidase BG5 [Benincasa hispida]
MAKLSHIIVIFMVFVSSIVGAYDVLLGAYYRLAGNNLPPPWEVVQLCKKYNIRRVRLYEPNLTVLESFRGMGIDVSFGVPNNLIENMATNHTAVEEWFINYVAPFIGDFTINYIVVGDKVIPGLDGRILQVMQSLQGLLNARNLGQVKLTTLVSITALSAQSPPSSGAFDPTIAANMRGILHFLWEQGSPLMVSLYPHKTYFYSGNMSLGYATFAEENFSIRDGDLSYNNLFDEMMDAFYAAIDKEDVGDVAIAVGETGWPTCGHLNITTTSIAATYNRNFKNHITSGKGTPMKSNIYIQGFIKSIFNENEEPEGESKCYGMFHVDSTPIYSPVF